MMDRPRTSAVVFDLDDTLYPERAYAFSGFKAVAVAFANSLGDPGEVAEQMRTLFDSPDRHRVFDATLAWRDRAGDTDLVQRMIATFRSHRPTIALHADAAAAMSRLANQYKFGLITDGPATVQWNKIDALCVRDRFDYVVVTADLGSGFSKPHKRAFEQMADRLGAAHSACAYVADNRSKDFVAPRALGWKTVCIVRDDGIYRDTPAVAHGEPQHTIATLDQLDALLV